MRALEDRELVRSLPFSTVQAKLQNPAPSAPSRAVHGAQHVYGRPALLVRRFVLLAVVNGLRQTTLRNSPVVSPVVRYRGIAYLTGMVFQLMRTRHVFGSRYPISERSGLALLVLSYLVICCLSSIYVTQFFPTYRMAYDPARLFEASVAVAAFAPVLLLFAFARFSFGYFVGFYFSSMFIGYLWITFFSDYVYDRRTASLSAIASAVAFLLPALFMLSPIRQIGTMSVRTFDRLLALIFLFCLVTVAVGASYNFRIANPGDVSRLRTDPFPAILSYLISITSSSLLPFLFACFLARKKFLSAGGVLVLLLFYYPVAMSKVAFFAPIWLTLMALLSRISAARIAVILSLLMPALAGVLLLFLSDKHGASSSYFLIVNFRTIAIPSVALDVYNDFFSKHELTYFCQIWILKPVINCRYQNPLSIVMSQNYPFGGNFNASLFATEGVASVGLLLAPVSALACGLIVALGNRLSAGLPPSFVLVSSAILAQILLNVPLTTVLLSHGAGLLFLLWYITPRDMFPEEG
jgi:hypothetical protein